VKLTDLDPRWACDADIVIGGEIQHFNGRHGMAVSFECPCCRFTPRATRLAVWFSNPIDGLPPTDDASKLWGRSGTTFDDLSLSPSIDASAHGHWHGFITGGEVR
jgi:hypothetical protein